MHDCNDTVDALMSAKKARGCKHARGEQVLCMASSTLCGRHNTVATVQILRRGSLQYNLASSEQLARTRACRPYEPSTCTMVSSSVSTYRRAPMPSSRRLTIGYSTTCVLGRLLRADVVA